MSRALEQRRIVTENLLMKEELAVRRGAPQLVGEDPSLAQGVRVAAARGRHRHDRALEGESGTGKELFARSLHALSPRADAPFVAINCAAIPENLLETELFGHEKGAFTGAVARKPGKFEMAHRGTLFLDEIGELPLPLQAKILRALEEQRFERVGGTALDPGRRAARRRHEPRPAGRGRGAAVPRGPVLPPVGVPDHVPPLRERAGDIPLLARHFVERFCRDLKKRTLVALAAGARALRTYRWPGNVRELQNCIERAVILADGDTILPRHLNLSFAAPEAEPPASPWAHIDLSGTLADATRRVVSEVERIKLGDGRSKKPTATRRRAAETPADRLQDAARQAARAPARVTVRPAARCACASLRRARPG